MIFFIEFSELSLHEKFHPTTQVSKESFLNELQCWIVDIKRVFIFFLVLVFIHAFVEACENAELGIKSNVFVSIMLQGCIRSFRIMNHV